MAEHLYQTIYNDLLEQIESGEYTENAKLPTEHELMRQYGVSRVTAMTALNMLRDQGLIMRIPRVGSIVRGATSPIGAHGNIQFVTISASNTIPGLYEAICDEAAKFGWSAVMYNTHHSIEAERECLRSILSRRVAGVICYPLNGEFGYLSVFEQLKNAGVPLVTVDKRVWLPHGSIPCVTTDNLRATYELTSWLIEKMGHRRIAYCCALFTQANARYRFKGYVASLSDHGIEYDPALTDEMERPVMPYRPLKPDYRNYLTYLMSLSEPPTAVVCECDYVALALMKSARELGISIPDQLSVVGFDNVDICEMLDVPLTTMEQNFPEIGRAAVNMLHALIKGEPVEPLRLFDARLIERSSVKKIDRS